MDPRQRLFPSMNQHEANTHLFATFSVLPVLIAQVGDAVPFRLHALGLLEGLAECTSADLAVLVEAVFQNDTT